MDKGILHLYRTQIKDSVFWVGYFFFCGLPILGKLLSTGVLRFDWVLISLVAYWCVFPLAIAAIGSLFES